MILVAHGGPGIRTGAVQGSLDSPKVCHYLFNTNKEYVTGPGRGQTMQNGFRSPRLCPPCLRTKVISEVPTLSPFLYFSRSPSESAILCRTFGS